MALAWLAAAFIAGVGLGTDLNVPAVGLIAIAVGASVAASRWREASIPLLCTAAFLLGVARAPHGDSLPGRHDVARYNGREVQVTGVVTEEPDIRDTGVNLVVDARQITLGSHLTSVGGRIEVHTARSQAVDYGHLVTLSGRIRAPQNTRTAPFAAILARRGIFSTMRFPRISDAGAVATGPLGWIVPLRQLLEKNMNAWLPEPEAALLIAITLGAHSASLGDLTPLLIATGLIHIIAISGIKVAMVAGTLYATASRLRQPRLTLLLTLAALWTYVLLTGATVSGERSAAMWTLVFVGAALGRGTVSLVSLSVVAAVIVALDPSVLGDSAFLLTTVGTFAIVALTNPILGWLWMIPSPVREAFGVTLSAQIGTLPIVAIGFHVVSLSGPLANAVVLPLLPFLIAAGFLLGACSSVALLAAPISALTYALLHAVVLLVGWIAALPGAIAVSAVPLALVAVYYLVLAALAGWTLRTQHWAPVGRAPAHGRELLLAVVVGASLASVSASHAETHGSRMVWLGSGNAVLLRDGDQSVLIDGSSHPYQLLERLGRYLPLDAHSIDAVVVTDPRAGNIVGLRAVLQHYRVGTVLDVGAEYPSVTYAAWRADVRRLATPAYALRRGATLRLGSLSLQAVAPDGLRPKTEDSAGVVRIRAKGMTVLLVSTASVQEQHELLFQSVPLRAQILVAEGKARDGGLLRNVAPHRVFAPSCSHGGSLRRLGAGTLLASFP